MAIARSAWAMTVTDCDAVLLPLFGSAVLAETLAESTAGPELGAVIERVSGGAELDAVIGVDVEQVATLPLSGPQVQPGPEKVNEVTPAGKVLEMVTVPLVASGPVLETLSVNDSELPALTGLLDAVLVSERSADGRTVVNAGPTLLLAVFGSNSVAVTEALFEIVASVGAFRIRVTFTD